MANFGSAVPAPVTSAMAPMQATMGSTRSQATMASVLPSTGGGEEEAAVTPTVLRSALTSMKKGKRK